MSTDCDTAITQSWHVDDENSAAMIALHARRSAPSIHAWAAKHPDKPLIVVLTGTDLYRDILTDADAKQSLDLATQLVVLQDAGTNALPERLRNKTRIIYQSARRLKPASKSTQYFKAVMVGHLRDEKDPLTFIKAAHLCNTKTFRFEHIGDGLNNALANAAKQASDAQTNYRWLGGLPRGQTRQHIKRAHVLVNCSVMEGGAHVILEAVQSGTAVLASRISGNVGMLGADYAGYFEVGDAVSLSNLIEHCATKPSFLAHLQAQCSLRAELFQPDIERRLVLKLLTPDRTLIEP